jgi:hypothetical protein
VPPEQNEKGQPKTCPFCDYPPYPIHTKNTNTFFFNQRGLKTGAFITIHFHVLFFTATFSIFFSNAMPVRISGWEIGLNENSCVETRYRFV